MTGVRSARTFTISVSRETDSWSVAFTGILNVEGGRALWEAVKHCLSSDCPRVWIDCTTAEEIDQAGAATLARIRELGNRQSVTITAVGKNRTSSQSFSEKTPAAGETRYGVGGGVKGNGQSHAPWLRHGAKATDGHSREPVEGLSAGYPAALDPGAGKASDKTEIADPSESSPGVTGASWVPFVVEDTASGAPDSAVSDLQGPEQYRRRLGHRAQRLLLQRGVALLLDLGALMAASLLSWLILGNFEWLQLTFIGFTLLVLSLGAEERLHASALDDVGLVLGRVCMSYLLVSTLWLALLDESVNRLTLQAIFAVPVLLGGRAVSHAAKMSLRKDVGRLRALVLGGGVVAQRVIATLGEHAEYGLEIVGAADDWPKMTEEELGARMFGGLDDVPAIIRDHEVDALIVAFSTSDQGRVIDLISQARAEGIAVWIVPRFFEVATATGPGDHIWGLPILKLRSAAQERLEWWVKRSVDYIVAGAGVLVLSPIMAITGLAIFLESGRPIFYRQRRIGIDGRPFNILKFRSMRASEGDAEATGWGTEQLRLTRMGRLLRATDFDEVPQLLNVLRGEMSLVGPRPERPYFVDLFSQLYPQYQGRHRFPPGITGWAQIHGLRGETSIQERAAFDHHYIENWSLGQDLRIALMTIRVSLRGKHGPVA